MLKLSFAEFFVTRTKLT